MKADEFKPCINCGKGVLHTGLPLFWTLKIQRLGVEMRKVQQVSAMEQYFGGASNPGALAIARVFENPELTKPVMDEITVLLCETCSTTDIVLAILVEHANSRAAAAKEKLENETP